MRAKSRWDSTARLTVEGFRRNARKRTNQFPKLNVVGSIPITRSKPFSHEATGLGLHAIERITPASCVNGMTTQRHSR